MIANSARFCCPHVAHVTSLECGSPNELASASIICPTISRAILVRYSGRFLKIFWLGVHALSFRSFTRNTKLNWCARLIPFVAQLLICACKTGMRIRLIYVRATYPKPWGTTGSPGCHTKTRICSFIVVLESKEAYRGNRRRVGDP